MAPGGPYPTPTEKKTQHNPILEPSAQHLSKRSKPVELTFSDIQYNAPLVSGLLAQGVVGLLQSDVSLSCIETRASEALPRNMASET